MWLSPSEMRDRRSSTEVVDQCGLLSCYPAVSLSGMRRSRMQSKGLYRNRVRRDGTKAGPSTRDCATRKSGESKKRGHSLGMTIFYSFVAAHLKVRPFGAKGERRIARLL